MRKKLELLLMLLLPVAVSAQMRPANYYQSIEVFAGMGTTHYFGEVGGPSNEFGGLLASLDNLGIDPLQTRLGWSLGGRFEFRKDMAVRASINPIWINGNDHNSVREHRGYYFDSFLTEIELGYEYYFAQRTTGLAPYGNLGLAAAFYTYRRKEEAWAKFNYSPVIIFGIGTRLPSRTRYTHSLELGYNYMLTDLLDGMKGIRKIGDSFYFIRYLFNFELDKTFIYDHRGLIR